MSCHRFVVIAASLAAGCVAVLVAPASARADGPPDAVRADDAPFRFAGRAIYTGGGAGMLTDVGTATENWSILAMFPLAGRGPDGLPADHGALRWFSVEATTFGFHFASDQPSARTSGSVALGIGVGMRVAPPANAPLRPYVAARFEHIHMLWDPMTPGETDTTSQHRWGFGGALGLEFRLSQRLRGAVEAGPTLFSGTGTHGGGQAVALLGIGF